MTTRSTFALCLLLAAPVLATAQSTSDPATDPLPPTAPTGPTDLDHYKCYFVQSPEQQIPLLLQDQFDLGATPPQVETISDVRLVRFCNPVQKTLNGVTTKILRPADFLALYLLNPQPSTPRRALITNQFGAQSLALRNALILAVPSGSATPPAVPTIPTNLDHYKCYSASGEKIGVSVTLTDTFHTEFVQVLEPILFCNPVHKTYPVGTSPTKIQRPAAHLACYTITPIPFQGVITYNNQLVPATTGPPTVPVSEADILCAPSFKLQWYPIPPPTAANGSTP
jgi:hypothetical protein